MHSSSLSVLLMVPMALQCCHMIRGWAHTKKGSLFLFTSYFVAVLPHGGRRAWYRNIVIFGPKKLYNLVSDGIRNIYLRLIMPEPLHLPQLPT